MEIGWGLEWCQVPTVAEGIIAVSGLNAGLRFVYADQFQGCLYHVIWSWFH